MNRLDAKQGNAASALEPAWIGLPGMSRDADPRQLGFKAANLLRMAQLDLPVPQGFVLGTAGCTAYLADPAAFRPQLQAALERGLTVLEGACQLGFGAARRPLLVSVRSGAPVSMPGMLDTILNVGLCDTALPGLLRLTGNPRLVWDAYRRLIQQFAEVVHGVAAAAFRAATEQACHQAGIDDPRLLDFHALRELTGSYQAIYREAVGADFPQAPRTQLAQAAEAVYASWRSPRAQAFRRLNGIADELGTAVTVQRMVFGNAGGTSGAGVGFTRDPARGTPQLYLDFLFNAQGEDVVSGRFRAHDSQRLAEYLPAVQHELQDIANRLEAAFGDVQDFEFTVENGRLFMLQTRRAKRTPWAALRIAVDRVSEGRLKPREALAQLQGIDLDALEEQVLEQAPAALASGVAAGIGIVSGHIALDLAEVDALNAAGRPALLVRPDIATEDIAGIAAAAGILTAQGSRTAHAAVVARQLGKVCIVGCECLSIDRAAHCIRFGEQSFQAGDELTLDTSTDGIARVFAGRLQLIRHKPLAWLAEVERWRQAQPA
ncbi:PEP/pyruvate-binding domain-containing protein [Plasticicumulans acidivorans]|uniref:Pyruvate phosphate dikinase n=1 Tax=Plasticicumulans acidivorans TaxID=886464 RepID=A0A317MV75_9GAMM|nr:PEP/pyruvate-binding domain-containing protein [Plasticicumulans acidivorans]PWV61031.1 pyruvate phosphate dikinase [Plasticicumulans acidivorans]